MKLKHIAIIYMLGMVIISCAPSTNATETVIAQTDAALPSFTPSHEPSATATETPELTSTNTVTSTKTASPTKKTTPTKTGTPTQTATPFNTSGCVDMEINISIPNENFLEILLTQKKSYDTKCVRLLYAPEYGYFSPQSLFFVFELSNQGARGNIEILSDESTPKSINKPIKYSYIWGIFQAPSTLIIRRVDELPDNQYPIVDGLYGVGIDGQIAPGIWKSVSSPTETNSCYWARINPQTGDINDNHFGIAGIKVRVYEGEVFEIDGCGLWIYVSP